MRGFFLVGLMLVGVPVFAQCPAGIPAGNNPLCIPPDNPNSPYYQSGGSAETVPVGRWEKRWGAFVIDDKVGLGVSRDMPSKKIAQSAAMQDCQRKGGTQCKVQLVYSNQCGVIIEGDRGYNTARAPTVERATEAGLEVCNRSDRNCQVYFSDCTHAVLVK